MVTARTTTARQVSAGARKPTKADSSEEAKLAQDLTRVLKVSEDSNGPIKARPRPLKTIGSSKTTSRKSTVVPANKAAPARHAGPSASRKTAPSFAAAKSPAATQTQPDLPWAKHSDMTAPQRAQAAMAAINAGMKELSAAIQAGYYYGEEKQGEDTWTVEKMETSVQNCQMALKVLSEMDEGGALGPKGIEVVKAAQGLAIKCLTLGMYERALQQLSMNRPALLRRYAPVDDQSSSTPSSSNEAVPSRGSRPVSKISTARSAQPSKASSAQSMSSDIRSRWLDLAWMPAPKEGTEIDDTVKGLLCLAMSAAWMGLMEMGLPSEDASALIPLPHPITQTRDPVRLHPLELAKSVPLTTTNPTLLALYRKFTNRTTSNSLQWLHNRTMSLFTLTLTITTSNPPSKTTPAQLWELTTRVLTALVQSKRNNARSAASNALTQLVDWVEDVVQCRGEKAEDWFGGEEWMNLMDFWITLARKERDSGVIERALSLMTASTTISSTVVSSEDATSSSQIREASSLSSRRSAKGKQRADAATTDLARLCGELANTTIVVEKYIVSPSDLNKAAVESALRSTEMTDIEDALLALDESKNSREILEKTHRTVERMRRQCTKVLDRESQGTSSDSTSTLLTAVHRLLVSVVDLAEDLLQAPLDISTLMKSLVPGALDSVLAICRATMTSDSNILASLERGHRMCILSKSLTQPSPRADWLRCLETAAYNTAARLWTNGNTKESRTFGVRSCEWASQAWNLVPDEEKDEKTWKNLSEVMSKRYELVGACSQKLGERKSACEALFMAIGYTPGHILESVEERVTSQSFRSVFAVTNDVNGLLSRLTSTILFEPQVVSGQMKTHLDKMASLGMSPTAVGAIGERLFELLSDGQMKKGVPEVMFEMGDVLLDIYKAELMPVRRLSLRLMNRMMALISQTGASSDRFEKLVAQVQGLAERQDFAHDQALAAFKGEHVTMAHLIHALYTYHTDEQPSMTVLQASQKVMAELRQLLVPPTNKPVPEKIAEINGKTLSAKRAVTRTPARPKRTTARVVSDSKAATKPIQTTARGVSVSKISPVAEITVKFDDVARLSDLFYALSNLLGMLGHVFAKIEALKLLRAILRNENELVNVYVQCSSQLGIEYLKLGKNTRAKSVLSQAFQCVRDSKKKPSLGVQVELRLRQSIFWSMTNEIDLAEAEYAEAARTETDIQPSQGAKAFATQITEKGESLSRTALARSAMAAMSLAKGNAAAALAHLSASYRLFSRSADVACRRPQTESTASASAAANSDPFIAPPPPVAIGADEPSKDAQISANAQTTAGFFEGKHLHGTQWLAAEDLLTLLFVYSSALANRGSVAEADYFLQRANEMAKVVKSANMSARASAGMAELKYRLRKYDESIKNLKDASTALQATDGPDGIDIKRIQGDVFSKQDMIEQAGEMFDSATKEVQGLDAVFTAVEALLPSPKRPSKASTSSVAAAKETLLPNAFARILRQQAWLLREAGLAEDCESILEQVRDLALSVETKAEELYLDGRIGLHEAISHFKTDLWMSSLTESTIAMPMGNPEQRTSDRQSTRQSIQIILQQSEQAFLAALTLATGSGRVEDVRHACLSLALVRAFQTSLGEGSASVTASAAAVLASSPAITLAREILEAIDSKFLDSARDDLKWVDLDSTEMTDVVSDKLTTASPTPNNVKLHDELDTAPDDDASLRTYWQSVKEKYSSNSYLTENVFNLDLLPPEWTVISINVTEDRNTMFISRHQHDHDPLVFTLPLDRQGRREGEAEEDLFTFDAATQQLQQIVDESNETARVTKNIVERQGKLDWWAKRYELDKRLQELLANMEFCWLGAFKTILSPRCNLSTSALDSFRARLERIFSSAISGNGAETKKGSKVHLDDALLECFAMLPAKCKDEEAEDLVYFILDIYQFHGVPVALAELDIDQIGIDVKSALTELETWSHVAPSSGTPSEHLFLALDKNVSGFPWESIPTLRGRAVSRVPSLPFLLDQVSMTKHVSRPMTSDGRRLVNSRRVFYIVNPSGDLTRTQTFFEPWINQMVEKAGWKGITGRKPTELEMLSALKDYDLVLYFGHGGAEQYVRSHQVRYLPKCATTMLWGCSSGHLKEQGDFDRAGTAWTYMIGGCPSLVANLWDVTDRDIDRLSEDVFKQLNLDVAHVGGKDKTTSPTHGNLLPISPLSTAQAVAKSREECRLKYLTGAAPVIYGLPMYMH